MDWNMVGALAEGLGAIAVVISLVYLAAQVRQNTGIARASYHIDQSAAYRSLVLTIVNNEDVAELWQRGLSDPAALSPVEYQRFSWIMGELFQHYQAQVEGAKAGLVPPHVIDSWGAVTASWIRMPGGRELWGVLGAFFPDEIHARLKEPLQATPPWDELMPRAFRADVLDAAEPEGSL